MKINIIKPGKHKHLKAFHPKTLLDLHTTSADQTLHSKLQSQYVWSGEPHSFTPGTVYFLATGTENRLSTQISKEKVEAIFIMFPNEKLNNHTQSSYKWNISVVNRTNLSASLWYRYEQFIFSFISVRISSTCFGILLLHWLT